VPEGDTVWRTAHRLDQALAGKVLTVCDLRWPSLATVDLRGATTTEVVARGKHVLHRLDSGVTLHSHLRMDGQWRVAATDAVRAGELRNERIRAVVGTSEWTCIGASLGMLDLVPTADEASLVGHLGPDLLGPDWDLPTALANLRRDPGRPIGEALLDQRLLAGIGTLYDSESLFLQRIHPWTPVGELEDAALERLVERARRLLEANSHRAVQSTTGNLRPGETAYVHARSGRPCRRCGAGVRVAMIGQPPQDRTMFYCPSCQGGLGPTDDGRPQRPMGSTGGGRQAGRAPRNERSGSRGYGASR
jgi:endonuclease VIII